MKITITFACILFLFIPAEAKRKINVQGKRAIIVDDRISVLRSRPDARSAMLQRLHKGRIIGILGHLRNKAGIEYLRISTSRNTRGWIMADAVARSGNIHDAEKLLALIDQTKDDYSKIMLSQICISQFRTTEYATRASQILIETAESVATRLTKDAEKKIGDNKSVPVELRREYMLNHSGLDRYNRIGVYFDFNPVSNQILFLTPKSACCKDAKILKE